MAQRFLGDDYDVIEKTRQPSERTLCGRIDLSPRGASPWQQPYGPAGAVQNKATDATMAAQLSLSGAYGPQCGPDSRSAEFLAGHAAFAWQSPSLRDMPSQPWTTFRAQK